MWLLRLLPFAKGMLMPVIVLAISLIGFNYVSSLKQELASLKDYTKDLEANVRSIEQHYKAQAKVLDEVSSKALRLKDDINKTKLKIVRDSNETNVCIDTANFILNSLSKKSRNNQAKNTK